MINSIVIGGFSSFFVQFPDLSAQSYKMGNSPTKDNDEPVENWLLKWANPETAEIKKLFEQQAFPKDIEPFFDTESETKCKPSFVLTEVCS